MECPQGHPRLHLQQTGTEGLQRAGSQLEWLCPILVASAPGKSSVTCSALGGQSHLRLCPKPMGAAWLGAPVQNDFGPTAPKVAPASLLTPRATSVKFHGPWARLCFSTTSSGGALGCAELLPLMHPGSSSHQEMHGISVKENKWLAGKKCICHKKMAR